MKKCHRCQEVKELSKFYSKGSYCRRCAYEYQKQWRQNHTEQGRKYQKKWREKNREKFLAYHRVQSKLYKEKNKEKIHAYFKENRDKILQQARQKYRSKHPFPIRLSEAELKARRKARYQCWGSEQRENLTDFYVIQCLKKFGFKKVDCTPRMIAAKRRQLKKRQKSLLRAMT